MKVVAYLDGQEIDADRALSWEEGPIHTTPLVTLAEAEAAVKQARIDALEEAKQACLNECVGKSLDDEELDESDLTYNTALRDAAGAIESLKGKP